jgi:hypothetical protein
MISVVLYGRNDAYGYNLHKRAALGINCMAEILTHEADEILFVDYNTPDDYPTFPEAIADTLTDQAIARLRVLRVRPVIHARVKDQTHLHAIEPIARNVAVRRSNPANRWILSTNTDMIFVPRGTASLSDIAADLTPGFYHLPRFELPESLWEGFDRKAPAAVIEQVRACGRSMFLNEIVLGADCIKYDAPGDFQLILRDDLFRMHGFNEDMLLGWHVDSNIAKRLYLTYGVVGDVVDRLYGYHCDHTRQVTPMHQHKAASNDTRVFIDNVTEPGLPHQARTWGCADDEIEEIRLERSTHHVFVDGLRSVLSGEWSEPTVARYTHDSFDQSTFDTRHVLPFLTDLFASAPRDWTVAWIGGRADLFDMFAESWNRLGFRGRILIDSWSVPLLAARHFGWVQVATPDEITRSADVMAFDFGVPSHARNPLDASGVAPERLDAAVDRLVRRSFAAAVSAERERVAEGQTPRRFICLNAVHNRYEALARDHIRVASTPFATRLRHGFVTPHPPPVEPEPPEMDVNEPVEPETSDLFNVLDRVQVPIGGRRTQAGILAPFLRRGYVFVGRPYERLMPGDYQVQFTIAPRNRLIAAACLRPVIVEVVGADGYLARERIKFLEREPRVLTVPFSVPASRREGQTGIEVRLFRGRFVDFVVTALRVWQVPIVPLPPVTEDSHTVPQNPLLQALGLAAVPNDASS